MRASMFDTARSIVALSASPWFIPAIVQAAKTTRDRARVTCGSGLTHVGPGGEGNVRRISNAETQATPRDRADTNFRETN